MVIMLPVVVILGGTALSLMLAPAGAIGRASNLGWWLIPVVVAAVIAAGNAMRRRRWSPNAPEVQTVMEDELRRANMLKASRGTLITVLALWPMAMGFSRIEWLPGERMAMIMAATTITIGLGLLISLFLFFDRD